MRLTLLALALLAAGLAAHADTFSTFTLNSTFNQGGGVITGSLILNTTTNQFSSASLTASGFGPAPENGTLNYIVQQITQNGEYRVDISRVSGGPLLVLELPVTSLSGYTGSSICSLSSSAGCLDPTRYDESPRATAGTLTLNAAVTAATPEPASILLLGTGLASLSGLLRRRSLVASA